MVTLLIIWFIANRHLFVHDTAEWSTYEIFCIVDHEQNAAREAEMNESINKIDSSIEFFTVKQIKKHVGQKVGTAKFYTQCKHHLDLEYDEEDYYNGHKYNHRNSIHGDHGSKGQRKGKFKTLAYKEAREYKRSRYQLEQTQLVIS